MSLSPAQQYTTRGGRTPMRKSRLKALWIKLDSSFTRWPHDWSIEQLQAAKDYVFDVIVPSCQKKDKNDEK